MNNDPRPALELPEKTQPPIRTAAMRASARDAASASNDTQLSTEGTGIALLRYAIASTRDDKPGQLRGSEDEKSKASHLSGRMLGFSPFA